ncbi:hypothetical protein JAAARDRAFT_69260 [Jaapia argillacea MUCL 33604]|uniref:Mitochondrial DNA polymerase catalytic subunit n=1 Tax=Jaapia argillacea MUCL 33604 TaxID=933084 RepID=A0A067Q5N3_9AGAM|nr:hypothetical protein JAAARDRAFT_69260 [Jaapia argillacea MUCL 33604]
MITRVQSSPTGLARWFHSSSCKFATKQKELPSKAPLQRSTLPRQKDDVREMDSRKDVVGKGKGKMPVQHVKRNELGVQMLSRKLHAQIFKNVSFPAPDQRFVQIAREHLSMHGLDPSQGSVLPDVGFTLPPLQGDNLDEHFHRIGSVAGQPWLSLSKLLASAELLPRPEDWNIHSGWTKYHYLPDGSSYCTQVDFPEHEGRSEEMLVFDVETMPEYSPYAIMACAVSQNGWYSWISPWLLGESKDPQQLIPLGDPTVPRVIVGHNVSYDRARILEEYSIKGTQNRFIDTMSLHVAIKGISSHQRPAWNKHRKSKQEAIEQKEEAMETIVDLIRRGELSDNSFDDADSSEGEADLSSKRWEDLTSANSLADVAKLHCGIEVEKEIRNDFMTRTPLEILENIQDYVGYCARDVAVTHAVFSQVLPGFLNACPSPVSFAGILTMGSSFLTVNEEWEAYIENAERTYRELDEKVKTRLLNLAQQAKEMMETEAWRGNVWLEQLDWTPKEAKESRGVFRQNITSDPSDAELLQTSAPAPSAPLIAKDDSQQPAWFRQVLDDGPLSLRVAKRILPLLLRLAFDGCPLVFSASDGWHYLRDGQIARLPTAGKTKTIHVIGAAHGLPALKNGRMTAVDVQLATAIASGDDSPVVADSVLQLAKRVCEDGNREDHWLSQLDWSSVPSATVHDQASVEKPSKSKAKAKPPKPPPVLWPKWYWELAKPKKGLPPGTLDLSVSKRIAPLLLRLSWLGWPLFHSHEHGWTFRVPRSEKFTTHASTLEFFHADDEPLSTMCDDHVFYKLPHKDGEKANVGSPLGKTFIKFAQDGTLRSPGNEAQEALDMNGQCSYWISARDRILNQLVLWQNDQRDLGVKELDEKPPRPDGRDRKWGMIIPQVITMGTVTRRAIEKTWLTASNAKKNRVGSELKAMVRAPEGYAIVGADVDSEELWISSVMGDAQFGLHGATAIGWMTLEGTKAAGTDLHSKTASILKISRDQAKVFNYSRIYGAGMKHAMLLLMQSNAGMVPDQAKLLAEQLYAQTKGKNTHRLDLFNRKFWFGGTESFVFNKLEEIALSEAPQTPALGCGITYALSKEYLPAGFGTDYMPSRINWVVQSSGVDYLHLLIVAMEHLIAKYSIRARYLISVHDELRYLVTEEDKYRLALALQVANLWTRSLFAYKLGMDDLPQGVAFFSSVDVDYVLRKEVDMPCVTPSQPTPLAPGESLTIQGVLDKTAGGSLWGNGRPMSEASGSESTDNLVLYREPNCLAHRARDAAWLRAQATNEFAEIKYLAKGPSGGQKERKRKSRDAGGVKASGIAAMEHDLYMSRQGW